KRDEEELIVWDKLDGIGSIHEGWGHMEAYNDDGEQIADVRISKEMMFFGVRVKVKAPNGEEETHILNIANIIGAKAREVAERLAGAEEK
ncbi:hypothetical protein, partial [Oenococcus oeni]|uniref:hypothetical protein n=1 Tax=Oenococcus oeni TaxID=1247 RepID=UPI001C5B28F2